jgi:hypothetical protein
MTVDAWLRAAVADATSRGLADIEPILKALAEATRALRAADFNDRPPGDRANDRGAAPLSSDHAREP